MSFKIAIIGAGPAGCMLARLLLVLPQAVALDITVFESDASPASRSQGGTLDLHESSGLAALRKAGLYDEFLKHARFDGAALKVLDKRGNAWAKISADANGKPEIDREKLRSLLYEGLEEGMVRWGRRLDEMVEREGKKELRFKDGSVESGFDLIVGGDGAWSRTRKFLDPDTKPAYAGVTRYWNTIPNAEVAAPEVHAFVNRGSVFSYSDGKAIMGQQLGSGHIDVGTYRVEPLEESVRTVGSDKVLGYFGDWTDDLTGFLRAARRSVGEGKEEGGDWVRLPLYELPVGYKWLHREGVTLIGDAAHLMTPFAGEGVNLAFVDSMQLATAILASTNPSTLDANIRLYETDLHQRATRAQAMTLGMKEDMLFTPGAPRTSIESWILRRMRFELGEDWWVRVVWPLCVGGVYAAYTGVRAWFWWCGR